MTVRQQRLTVLLDPVVRDTFDAMCVARFTNASAVLRALIDGFLEGSSRAFAGDYTPVNILPMPATVRETKTSRLTILITPQMKQDFEEACASLDLTASQVVRRLIREWMEASEPATAARAPKKRAAAAKKVRSRQ
jgi:hypothetical protein